MTRINRPDTLLTELRDIKRRLHALETAQRATAAASVQTTMAAGTAATDAEAAEPQDEPQ
ncbi:hypothetical protein [Streptomyces geranii]|uniref:hypothetical protein n=1 Tax=Streptomyces geranii TaxID=2058923 RepID=UPI000D031019|nr:hypothetical protein [Streptomyces geranii]